MAEASTDTTTRFQAPVRTPSAESKPLAPKEWHSHIEPDWCAGCGDFGVLNTLARACSELGLQRKDVLTVSGIGCSSNFPGFFSSYGMHTLHGRAVAVAQGAKLANPELTVIITGGDGDGYGIGLGHFVHAMRRNIDVTYVVMNNQVYGLTTGQASPTTTLGTKTKSTPEGDIEHPINPIALALATGATFVARAFSGDPNHMGEVFKRAIQHKGFSLVDCFSPCVTYNKINTYPWFRQRVYKLEQAKHDPADFKAALEKAFEDLEKKVPIGVFYAKAGVATYEELDPAISRHGPPVKLKLGLSPQERQELLAGFY